MRKNILYALFLFVISFGLASCDDFLETVDKTNNVESNFFTNQQECEQALWGCYSILQQTNHQFIHQVAESLSDNCHLGAGTDGNETWDEFRDNGEQNMYERLWKKAQWGVHRTNFLLEKLPGAPLKDDVRRELEAETKFLRAYFYFDFIKCFGNIPLSKSSEGRDLPQANPKDVYKLIAEDLLFASENLPSNYSEQWFGRATNWAAKSLLARVYLYYTGYYQENDLAGVVNGDKIRVYVEDVIENSGHKLLDDYRSLWPYSQLTYYTKEAESLFAGEANDEIIFTIKYSDEGTGESFLESSFDESFISTGNTWLIYMGPRFSSNYEANSAAKPKPFRDGWGFMPVVRSLYDDFDANDVRRDASIADLETEFGYSAGDNQKDYTGLWQQKYQPLLDETGKPIAGNDGSAWQYGQGQDYYIIRFADVLLMGAELFLETDQAKAQGYFNQVRKRAFGAAYAEIPVTKDNIFEERRFELAFEGLRYFDLLRYDGQNKLDYAKSRIDAKTGTVIRDLKEVDKVVNFRKETKGLLQIPHNQINLSKELKQNPGWEM